MKPHRLDPKWKEIKNSWVWSEFLDWMENYCNQKVTEVLNETDPDTIIRRQGEARGAWALLETLQLEVLSEDEKDEVLKGRV